MPRNWLRRWTPEEEQILRDNEGKSLRQLRELLPDRASLHGIRNRMNKMGLRWEWGRGKLQWTEEEIQILRDNCETKTAKEISKMVGRCAKAVTDRAKILGIRVLHKAFQGGSMRFWTEQDINYLKAHAGEMSLGEIAKNLRRTHHAVHLKAFNLGIKLYPNTYYAPEIAKMLRVHPSTVFTYKTKLGQKWGSRDVKHKSYNPGATFEEVQAIAAELLRSNGVHLRVSAKHLRQIVEADPLIGAADYLKSREQAQCSE